MSIFENNFDAASYLEGCLQFLHEYQWVFSSSNTAYLKENILQRLPSEWKEYFITVDNENLNRFPDGLNSRDGLPESLKVFQEKLQSFKSKVNLPQIEPCEILMKRMSPKKTHEIMQLSKLIVDQMDDDVSLLIDFGSGLGYLSEILGKSNKFRILGLECDPKRVDVAKQRQIDHYPESMPNIVYETMSITQNSGANIESLCRCHFPDTEHRCHAIIGLHACGDLSITAMNIFLESNCIQKLIIMPCCYHKLEISEEQGSVRAFKHFPLSSCLKQTMDRSPDGWKILDRPFLRLACQQTASSWRNKSADDHRKHGWRMFVRAIAECLAKEDEIITKVKGGKGEKSEKMGDAFFCLTARYQLVSNDWQTQWDWTEEHKKQTDELCSANPNGDILSEGLTCVQTALQELCERIVLLDRVCYLKEKANEMNIQIIVDVRKILNDKLSPRCHAFIAEKRNKIGLET